MDRLADTSLVGGERTDATDHCLAGIARLSNEVKDAASYIPTYDQRIYAEVRSMHDIPILLTWYLMVLTGYKSSARQTSRDPSYG